MATYDDNPQQFTLDIPEIHREYKDKIDKISHKELCSLLGEAISTIINRQQRQEKSHSHHI
jgi:hypothetical protein